jgi:hypothetical protein
MSFNEPIVESVNNGRVDWKTKDGKTIKDLQEALAKA